MTTRSLPATRPHAERRELYAEALFLHRISWGGALKISKLLSRRHSVDLSQWTVCDWLRGVPRDLDPLSAQQPH
jgi:hypothetical protein